MFFSRTTVQCQVGRTIMKDYSHGGVAGLVSKKNKKKKSDKSPGKMKIESNTELQSLFSDENLVKQKAEQKQYEISVSKAAEMKKEKKKKKENKIEEVAAEEGFCPPTGYQHISLQQNQKKKKRRFESTGLEDEDGMSKRMRHYEDEIGSEAARRRLKNKDKTVQKVDPCTIFVGNLPINYDKKDIKKIFMEYGAIDSLRIRSVVPSEVKLPKKAAAITKNFKKECTSLNAFVKFKTEESAQESLKSNGLLVDDHHIRVDLVTKAKALDHKHSVFVGNLPLTATNDEVWNFFEDCGTITNVRLVRDKTSNLGKGFGFVTFEDVSCVALAMKLNGGELKGRKLRVMASVKKQKIVKTDKKSRVPMNKVKGKRGSSAVRSKTEKPKKQFSRPSNAARGSFHKPKVINKKKKDDKAKKMKQFRNKKKSQKTKGGSNKKGKKS
ncbi:uncharacterized protein LOC141911173 isoform X2 [Tubulanus polymorphus]|uniref:uncharacterized protein LOC141911173 isoform X2 n=1 Tax=Tubulanus polymorphus TaxID=672921 RepID=UPI003DA3C655